MRCINDNFVVYLTYPCDIFYIFFSNHLLSFLFTMCLFYSQINLIIVQLIGFAAALGWLGKYLPHRHVSYLCGDVEFVILFVAF